MFVCLLRVCDSFPGQTLCTFLTFDITFFMSLWKKRNKKVRMVIDNQSDLAVMDVWEFVSENRRFFVWTIQIYEVVEVHIWHDLLTC